MLRGAAPEALLDTYGEERHPVGKRVLHMSDLILRSLLIRNTRLRTVRELTAKALVPLPPVRRKLSENLSNIGVNYRPAGWAREEGASGGGALRAGDRVPDLELADADGSPARLYELLRTTSYSLFIAIAPDGVDRDRGELVRLLETGGVTSGGIVNPRVILEQGIPEEAGVNAPIFVDYKRQFRAKTGAEHGSVMLVRPDGYLAFHRRTLDAQEITATLERWICRPSDRTTTQEKASSGQRR